MNSNENDAMEWNDVLSEMNILICYVPKTELRMRSYNDMNMCIWNMENSGTWWNFTPREKSTRDEEIRDGVDPVRDGAV